jgi:hypothetical protein
MFARMVSAEITGVQLIPVGRLTKALTPLSLKAGPHKPPLSVAWQSKSRGFLTDRASLLRLLLPSRILDGEEEPHDDSRSQTSNEQGSQKHFYGVA